MIAETILGILVVGYAWKCVVELLEIITDLKIGIRNLNRRIDKLQNAEADRELSS